MMLIGLLSVASAATLTVPNTLPGSIQNTINLASSGDTVYIPAGVYPNGSTILVNKNLTITGDGCGLGGTEVGNFTNLGDVFLVAGMDNVEFRNFEITRSGSGTPRGIHIAGSTVRVSNMCFEDLGDSTLFGGAILVAGGSSLESASSEFRRNAGQDGAAILASSSTVVLDDSVFDDNDGTNGAIWADGSSLTVKVSTFKNNDSSNDGGAIWAYWSGLSIFDSTFEQNSAGNAGGAAYADDSVIWVEGTTFRDNDANTAGGALFFEQLPAAAEIHDSTFVDNAVPFSDGGAVAMQAASLAVWNSTFEMNSAGGNGGAIWSFDFTGTYPQLFVTESTFVQNSAGNDGGGVYYANLSDATLTQNVFIENSSSDAGGAIRSFGTDQSDIAESFFCENNADTGSAYASGFTANQDTWRQNIAIRNDSTTYATVAMNDFGGGSLFEVLDSSFIDNDAPVSTGVYADSWGGGFFFVWSSLFTDSDPGATLYAPSTINESTDFLEWNNTLPLCQNWPSCTYVSADPMLTVASTCTGQTVAGLTSAVGFGADPSQVPLP